MNYIQHTRFSDGASRAGIAGRAELNARHTRSGAHTLPPRTTVQAARFRSEKRIDSDAVAAATA